MNRSRSFAVLFDKLSRIERQSRPKYKSAVPNWFIRRTLHVPNLIIRFGTCKVRRLNRALMVLEPGQLPSASRNKWWHESIIVDMIASLRYQGRRKTVNISRADHNSIRVKWKVTEFSLRRYNLRNEEYLFTNCLFSSSFLNEFWAKYLYYHNNTIQLFEFRELKVIEPSIIR